MFTKDINKDVTQSHLISVPPLLMSFLPVKAAGGLIMGPEQEPIYWQHGRLRGLCLSRGSSPALPWQHSDWHGHPFSASERMRKD